MNLIAQTCANDFHPSSPVHGCSSYTMTSIMTIASVGIALMFFVTVVDAYIFQRSQRRPLMKIDGIPKSNPLSGIPTSLREVNRVETGKVLMRALGAATVIGGSRISESKAVSGSDEVYRDANGRFTIAIPPSFSIMPRKVPTPSLLEYTTEESLLSATSFAEGSSMSVTKTVAPLLLKDFKMDWWFSPLQTIKDVGSPSLIATLLVLQRQGEFKKKETTSEILDAKFVDEETLLFSFVTPLAPSVQRKTIVKSIFKDNALFTVWVSALTSVFEAEGGFGPTLLSTRESFSLQ